MKAKEFDKIDYTFRRINNNTIDRCNENSVCFYNYVGDFVNYGLYNYRKLKTLINTINNLDFSDRVSVRATLNKRHFKSKDEELILAKKHFKDRQIKVFEWLDETNDPYFFILNPLYKYGAGIDYSNYISNRYGYTKIHDTGLNNIDIAIEYMNYKLINNAGN